MIHVNDPGFNEHLFRENFNMHTFHQPPVQHDREPGRGAEASGDGRLTSSCSRTLCAFAGIARPDQLDRAVFRVLELDQLIPEEVKRDNIRLDPTKVTVDISSCGYTVEDLQRELFDRYNIQVEKIHVQYADPAADDRHHTQQGFAAVRRADAYRARGPLAAPPVPVPGNPGFHAPSLPAARRLLLRRGAGAPGRRERQHQAGPASIGRAPTRSSLIPRASPCSSPGR